MNENLILSKPSEILAGPYSNSSPKLGTVTKIFSQKFICNERGLKNIHEKVCEKLTSFQPDSAGFQYIVSFTDNTHFENTDISKLKNTIEHSEKHTDKLILNWIIDKKTEEISNNISVIIRISNPVNPLMYLQAALSKSPEDLDNFEFEFGSISVSVSVSGATQMVSEEVFEIVGKWANGCPQPQSVTTLNKLLARHGEKIGFLNYWLLPIILVLAFFFYLRGLSTIEQMIPLLFVGIVAHGYIRKGSVCIPGSYLINS